MGLQNLNKFLLLNRGKLPPPTQTEPLHQEHPPVTSFRPADVIPLKASQPTTKKKEDHGWTCPTCGKGQPQRYEICPHCGTSHGQHRGFKPKEIDQRLSSLEKLEEHAELQNRRAASPAGPRKEPTRPLSVRTRPEPEITPEEFSLDVYDAPRRFGVIMKILGILQLLLVGAYGVFRANSIPPEEFTMVSLVERAGLPIGVGIVVCMLLWGVGHLLHVGSEIGRTVEASHRIAKRLLEKITREFG